MNYYKNLENAINYIEDNLTNQIKYDEIARQSGLSVFYFQRIFSAVCGYSVGWYIRSRRLSEAGQELRANGSKVIDVAFKYGYESPESFARAFIKFHGIAPSKAKKCGKSLKSFSRLSIKENIKGGIIMNYKIVKQNSFKVIEKVSAHEIDDSKNKNTIPEFWSQSHMDGTVSKLLSITNDRSFIYGICYGGDLTDKKTFDYSIAALYDGESEIPEGFRVSEIPSRTWAVFECVGAMPDAAQDTWHKICAEFFPNSNYEPTYEMDIEAYTAGDMCAPDYKCEIRVPIKDVD